MQTAATISLAPTRLFLTCFSSLKQFGDISEAIRHGGLYQRIANALITGIYKTHLEDVGNSLIQIADHALSFRQIDTAERASELLLNAPLPDKYQNIGQYYQALCIKGRQQSDLAQPLFERLATSVALPLKYRARAIQQLGIIAHEQGSLAEALRFYVEAGHAASLNQARDLETIVYAQWNTAVVKSCEGGNREALADLEKLAGPVQILAVNHPLTFYSFANSLAVELCELGRIEEAKAASHIALASPFAPSYTEWYETRQKIELKDRRTSRSVVAIRLPDQAIGDETELSEGAEDESEPSSVLLFPVSKLKEVERPKRPKAITEHELMRLTVAQKRALVLVLIHDEKTRGIDFDNILRAAGLIKEKEHPKLIDLESTSFVDDLVTDWCVMVGADNFAMFLSALRDCDDDWRRKIIIDTMISLAFRESQDSAGPEQAWREKVEAKLTPSPYASASQHNEEDETE
jgi:hypothetical protein